MQLICNLFFGVIKKARSAVYVAPLKKQMEYEVPLLSLQVTYIKMFSKVRGPLDCFRPPAFLSLLWEEALIFSSPS